ncbi:MAG: hypothetical protein ACLFN4_02735 [Candidatus Acetothermia bacterium]
MPTRGKKLLLIGGLLVTGSWVALFLIVLGALTVPFLVNLCLYGASISGLFLGFLGAAVYGGKGDPRE